MKAINIKTLAFLAAGIGLAGCSENSWNDHLDGFEEPTLQQVQSVSYTMTEADYATLAGLSANKELAGSEHAAALAAVGTQHYFTPSIPAAQYVPAFLANSTFKYFALSNGSSVSLTYNEAQEMPAEIEGIASAAEYTVSDNDYQKVWGSETDYTPSFAPSHTAAASLAGVIADNFPDAADGQYVIVNYMTSNVDPVFNGGDTPDMPGFTLSEVIGSVAVDGTYDINGIVIAVCNAGFILTDNSGSIFTYMGSGYDPSTYPIGTQLVASAQIGAYNKGLQISGSASTFEVKGSEESVEYPSPAVFSVSDIETIAGRTDNALAEYGQITGKVVISGNNINIDMGSETAMGGIYFATDEIKSALQEGETMTVTGYLIAVAAGKYVNFVATKVEAGTKAAPRRSPAKVVNVPSVNENAVYVKNEGRWNAAANTLILNPADYEAMGQRYGNLSSTAKPENYLPAYLKVKLPYAQAGDSRFVVYKYYADGTTSYKCDVYEYNGSEWTPRKNYVEVTSQFVKLDGKWMFDPNVTITLPSGRGQELSATYYQACVDWVYENIDVPLGSTSIKSGVGYVTSYGNNEYYSGTSAYQNNVDLRAASARAQYPKGYEGMTDEEVVALMKKRFCEEVMPGALSKLYPEARPFEGMQVVYTITFGVYTGSAATYTAKWEVVGPAQFKFLECDW